VREWRKSGLPAAYTIDAGPNVHVICSQENAAKVASELKLLPGVSNVLVATAGPAARLISG